MLYLPLTLAILAKNLPESNIMHMRYHPNIGLSWNWDTQPHVKYPDQGYTVPTPSKSNKRCCWTGV